MCACVVIDIHVLLHTESDIASSSDLSKCAVI